MVENCEHTEHLIFEESGNVVSEQRDLEKSISNPKDILAGHKTTITNQEAIIKKHEKLIEQRSDKKIDNIEEEFHDPLEDLSCKEDKSS